MPKLSTAFLILIFSAFIKVGTAQSTYQQEIKIAATNLVQTLNPVQKKMAMLSFTDTARVQWNNLPVGLRARAGISIGNMTEEQRKLLHRILSVSLSSQVT